MTVSIGLLSIVVVKFIKKILREKK